MPTVTHYTAYQPRPFTREERDQVTILYGGLTWKHERIMQGVFHNLHYKAQPLPNVSRDDLAAGKELIDVGACCPTTFTTGNLVNFLKAETATRGKTEVVDKYVFLTAGACGPCRFGQYSESYAMALDGIGLRDFRMFLLAQDQLDQGGSDGGGLEVNMPMTLGLVWALLCADTLSDLEYMVRPYEVKPGETDRVLRGSIEYLYEVFRDRPSPGTKWRALTWHVLTSYFARALREVKKRWDAIEVDRLQVKPMVKVTGEFWLEMHEGDGNYNIKRWLEQEGAEIIPPPLGVRLGYTLHSFIWKMEKRRRLDRYVLLKLALVHALEKMYYGTYNRFRRALGSLPRELPDQEELKRLAAPYYHYELRGGEGHMLVGKALAAYHHKHAHMTCELTPYSCMPNTMSVGSMASVLGAYPDLLYAPIEVKGDAEIHALSRCQMILTEAKRRAQRDFEEALERTGLTPEAIRRREAAHPELRRSTYRVRHYGYAGTAANYVMDLATRAPNAARGPARR